MNRDPAEVWKRHLWRPHVQQRKSETAGVPCSVVLYLRAAARGGRSRRAANYGNTIPDAAAAAAEVEVQMRERDLVRRSESSVNGCVDSAPRGDADLKTTDTVTAG